MTKLASKIISAILHPLLVPTYALLVLLNLKTHSILAIPENYRYIIVIFIFLTTFVIPTIVIFILLKLGKIVSLEMVSQRERVFPILFIAIVYYMTYHLLKQVGVTGLLTLFMIGSTMLVLLSLLINYATKISLHMTAWGGFLGTLLGFAIRFNYDLNILIYSTIILLGVIASARLKLNAHTPFQVYSGFLLGTLGMVILFFIV